MDMVFFYMGLVCYPLCWAVFVVLEFLTLDPIEVLLSFVGLFVSSLNLFAFYKCYFHHRN